MANTIIEEFVDIILKPGKTDSGDLTKAHKKLMDEVGKLFASKDQTVPVNLKVDIASFKEKLVKEASDIEKRMFKLQDAANGGKLDPRIRPKTIQDEFERKEKALADHTKKVAPLLNRLESLTNATIAVGKDKGGKAMYERALKEPDYYNNLNDLNRKRVQKYVASELSRQKETAKLNTTLSGMGVKSPFANKEFEDQRKATRRLATRMYKEDDEFEQNLRKQRDAGQAAKEEERLNKRQDLFAKANKSLQARRQAQAEAMGPRNVADEQAYLALKFTDPDAHVKAARPFLRQREQEEAARKAAASQSSKTAEKRDADFRKKLSDQAKSLQSEQGIRQSLYGATASKKGSLGDMKSFYEKQEKEALKSSAVEEAARKANEARLKAAAKEADKVAQKHSAENAKKLGVIGSAEAAPAHVKMLLERARKLDKHDPKAVQDFRNDTAQAIKDLRNLEKNADKAGVSLKGLFKGKFDTRDAVSSLQVAGKEVSAVAEKGKLLHQVQIGLQGFMRYFVIYGGLFKLFGAAGSYITGLVQYTDQLKQMQAIAQATDKEMVALSTTIKDLAGSKLNAVGIEEIGKAVTVLAQAGTAVKDMPEALKAVTAFATATGGTLEISADIITSAKQVFDTLSYGEVADKLTSAVNISKLKPQDIQQLMSLGAQTAKSINPANPAIMDQFLGAQATLSNVGIKPQTIATGTRQLSLEMFSPDDATIKYLKKRYSLLGEDLNEEEIKARMFAFKKAKNPYEAFLREFIRLGATGSGADEFARTVDVRAENVFKALMDNIDKLSENTAKIGAVGAAVEGATVRADSLSVSLTKLGNNLLSLGDEKMQGAQSFLKSIVDFVDSIVQSARGGLPAVKKNWVTESVQSLINVFPGGDLIKGAPAPGQGLRETAQRASDAASTAKQEALPYSPEGGYTTNAVKAEQAQGAYARLLSETFGPNSALAQAITDRMKPTGDLADTQSTSYKEAVAELGKLAVKGPLSTERQRLLYDASAEFTSSLHGLTGTIDEINKQAARLMESQLGHELPKAALDFLQWYQSNQGLFTSSGPIDAAGLKEATAKMFASLSQESAKADEAARNARINVMREDIRMDPTGMLTKAKATSMSRAGDVQGLTDTLGLLDELKRGNELFDSVKALLPQAKGMQARNKAAEEAKRQSPESNDLGMAESTAKSVTKTIEERLDLNKLQLKVAKGKGDVPEITRLINEQIGIMAAHNSALLQQAVAEHGLSKQDELEFQLREEELKALKEKLIQENIGADKLKKVTKLQEQQAEKVSKLSLAMSNAEEAYSKAKDAMAAFKTKKEDYKTSFEEAYAAIKGDQGEAPNAREGIQAQLDALGKRQNRGDFDKGDEAASKIKDAIVSAKQGGTLDEFDARSLLSSAEGMGKKSLKREEDYKQADLDQARSKLQIVGMDLETASKKMADLKKEAEALMSIKVSIDPVSLEQMRQALLTVGTGKAALSANDPLFGKPGGTQAPGTPAPPGTSSIAWEQAGPPAPKPTSYGTPTASPTGATANESAAILKRGDEARGAPSVKYDEAIRQINPRLEDKTRGRRDLSGLSPNGSYLQDAQNAMQASVNASAASMSDSMSAVDREESGQPTVINIPGMPPLPVRAKTDVLKEMERAVARSNLQNNGRQRVV